MLAVNGEKGSLYKPPKTFLRDFYVNEERGEFSKSDGVQSHGLQFLSHTSFHLQISGHKFLLYVVLFFPSYTWHYYALLSNHQELFDHNPRSVILSNPLAREIC